MRRFVPALVELTLLAGPAFGQNLVVNGEFASDISAWEKYGAAIEWDPLDWSASAGSGSIRVTNTEAFPAARAALQCIPFDLGLPIELGARIRFPSGQAPTGTAMVSALMFANPTCTPPSAGGANTGSLSTSTLDTWTNKFATGLRPLPGTRSIGLLLLVSKDQSGGELSALFDHVVFGPAGTTPVELQSFTVE